MLIISIWLTFDLFFKDIVYFNILLSGILFAHIILYGPKADITSGGILIFIIPGTDL